MLHQEIQLSSCMDQLMQLLAFATDELSLRVGQTLAGLLNATLVSFDGP